MAPANLIDGRAVARQLQGELVQRIAVLKASGVQPGLAFVRVGEDPASKVYVGRKEKTCAELGIFSETHVLPETSSEAELLELLARLNGDARLHGVLVQAPLPPHIRSAVVYATVRPEKDVDGFHPVNVARLADGQPGLVPCTPLGVMRLLAAAGVGVEGARAVVLGRSAIVGRPMAALLLTANATVTIAHSRTRDLPAECRRADILVAAVGRPEMVRGDWIAPGATVIDVGINRLPDKRLVGDVAYDEASRLAGAITPVPGGVGPMTIACLLENTVTAAMARRG